VTAAEFEQKWTSSPNGRLANKPERFNVARVAHAMRDRLNDGRDADEARRSVMREPYYRADLASAFDPLEGDGELLKDFNSIDAA
jgi:hypothetical protein